jgi:hypothetical protein
MVLETKVAIDQMTDATSAAVYEVHQRSGDHWAVAARFHTRADAQSSLDALVREGVDPALVRIRRLRSG